MSSSDHQATRTVTSWIQDERKCVSIGSIHTNLGLPKSQAQAVLRQVVDTNKNISYQATNCVVLEEEGVGGEDEKVVKCTVFKLQTDNLEASEQDSEKKQFLYALALLENNDNGKKEATETLLTAHERDMAQLRDKMVDNTVTATILDKSSLNDCIILPADAICVQMANAAAEAVPEDEEEEHDAKPKAVVPTFSKGPRKTTSAASFFNAKKTSDATMSTSKSKNTTTVSSTGAKKTESKIVPASQKKTSSEEKENLASEKKKKVGNADDFVGDLEDSDDDDDDDPMQVETEEPTRKVRSRKKPVSRKQIVENEPEPMDVEEPVTGVMDAFATQKKKQPVESADGTKRKRRRKKLVEKTTMDAAGYLHTETQEIWEDIPSDEDEKESSIVSQKLAYRPAQTKTKGTSGKAGMKQGNLMGFFSKK